MHTFEASAGPTLTFTGLDAFTDQSDILALHRKYRNAEFGVLVSGNSGDPDFPRYPHLSVVEEWRDFADKEGIPVALHLCGPFAQSVISGDVAEETLALCAGFGRVQVNARKYDYARLEKFAEQAGCRHVIVQHREPFSSTMPLDHPKVEYIYDRSGGQGKADFSQWPPPINLNARYGYAGGISPDNIRQALKFTSRYPQFQIWLDMETGVRNEQDRFDLEKAEKVSAAVSLHRTQREDAEFGE